MALTTTIKHLINQVIGPLGLKVETRLEERTEAQRLKRLENEGYFNGPAFPVPQCMQQSDWRQVTSAVPRYRTELARLQDPSKNDVGFTNTNAYYHPPDSEVLYTMVREHRPSRIIEIGSGNSTRIMRQAIRDGNLSTRVISIDPMPRSDIRGLADEVRSHPVEEIRAEQLASEIRAGDFLFIDSSHLVALGNDCVYEFLQLLPRICSGVIVHIHDISLPWDYPTAWIERESQTLGWAEQYLLQAILMSGEGFEVLWPGYYVQLTQKAAFEEAFPIRFGRDATSFWIRRK